MRGTQRRTCSVRNLVAKLDLPLDVCFCKRIVSLQSICHLVKRRLKEIAFLVGGWGKTLFTVSVRGN